MADPYKILGVGPDVSDAELRAAYRRQVRLHHPDHNGGSVESARRFEAVQEAYTAVLAMRRDHAAGQAKQARATSAPSGSPNIESRLADLERELRAAKAARERSREAAREAAREARERARQAAREATQTERPDDPGRPSDEELGYIKTDDSFSKILSDAAAGLSERFSDASDKLSEVNREHHVTQSVADLIDELGSRLTGEKRDRKP